MLGRKPLWCASVVAGAHLLAQAAAGQTPAKAAPPASAAGDTLCALIVKHFAGFMPANPKRGFVSSSGDTCQMGGAPIGSPKAGTVRVNANRSSGLTGPGLASMYSTDKAAHAVAGIADGAYEKAIDDQFVHKLAYGLATSGRLILIEIEFPKALTADDHTHAQAAVKALAADLK
jgi:hypothetical protein